MVRSILLYLYDTSSQAIQNLLTNIQPVIGTLYDSWSFSNVIYFMLFNGCWTTVIAVPYLGLAPIWFSRISHEFVIPFVEVVTMLLWLSGWIALAAMIPKPGACTYPSCHGLQALIVVAAVEW